MMQTDKSATLSTHNTQTLFDPIPIADKATRYKGGGDTRNNDGSANGLGIGEPGAPANTLTAADRHGVACFAQQAIGEYEESEKASCLKRRDYKDSTDLILWEYIIRMLTPLECCILQGVPDNWAEELGITEPTQEDIDHWREVFRTQMEAMGESKKEKTDNQICKWLKDPESDSAKYKMWGNGIALPCAMFVMEGIAMILSRRIQMSRNNRDYISCRNPAATKQQETGWNRMVRNLEHRKAKKENHRKEVKTNGRNT